MTRSDILLAKIQADTIEKKEALLDVLDQKIENVYSILSYGMRKGMLYGKEEAKTEIVSDMTAKMYTKVFDSDLDDKTKLDVIEMFRSCAAELDK